MSKIKNKPELYLENVSENVFLLNKDGEHFKMESDDIYFYFNHDLEIVWEYLLQQGSSKLNLSVMVYDQKSSGTFEVENEEDPKKFSFLSDINGVFDYEIELQDIKTVFDMNPLKDDFHLSSLKARVKEIRQIDNYKFRVIFDRIEAKF